MTEISEQLKLLYIGWFLGLLSSTLVPFIVDYIKNSIEKRNFEKILDEDVYRKWEHLKNIEQKIIKPKDDEFLFNAEDLDYVIKTIMDWKEKTRDYIPDRKYIFRDWRHLLTIETISMDFYMENYSKLLNYFSNKNGYIKLYQTILTLNSYTIKFEKYIDNNFEIYQETYGDIRHYMLGYCENLKSAITEGEKLLEGKRIG